MSIAPRPSNRDEQAAASPYVIDCAHYTVDGMDEEDNAGFCSPTCSCGWKSPPCPDWETAVDGLMQHAYEAGILTERNQRGS